jgi:hypothetical protein
MAFGDANRDRVVDLADLNLWRAALGIPEPNALALIAIAMLAALARRRSI